LFKGRAPALDEIKAAKLRQMAADGVAKVELAKTFGISRAGVYVYLKA